MALTHSKKSALKALIEEYNVKYDIDLFDNNSILSDRQVEFLKLYFHESKSMREIGEIYGITRNAVDNALTGRKNSVYSVLRGNKRLLAKTNIRKSFPSLDEMMLLIKDSNKEEIIEAISALNRPGIKRVYESIALARRGQNSNKE